MTPNTNTRRQIEPVIGWGPTAFNVQLSPTLQAQLFGGTGWLITDGQLNPIGTLEQFLDLQREGRISELP